MARMARIRNSRRKWRQGWWCQGRVSRVGHATGRLACTSSAKSAKSVVGSFARSHLGLLPWLCASPRPRPEGTTETGRGIFHFPEARGWQCPFGSRRVGAHQGRGNEVPDSLCRLMRRGFNRAFFPREKGDAAAGGNPGLGQALGLLLTKWLKRSIGMGRKVVVLFSLAISRMVWRKRSWRAMGSWLIMAAAWTIFSAA